MALKNNVRRKGKNKIMLVAVVLAVQWKLLGIRAVVVMMKMALRVVVVTVVMTRERKEP